MTDPRTDRPLFERLRRAGTASPTRPDMNQIMARATQRRRRRQIGVTAASVVVVGGLGLGSTQWLSGTTDTEITASGTPALGLAPAADSNPIPVSTATTAAPAPAEFAAPEATWETTTVPASTTSTTIQPEPSSSEIADGVGGTVLVEAGRLAHRNKAGVVQPIDLPTAGPTTERRVTDLAPMAGRPYLLVADFTDRPDLAAEMATELGLGPEDARTGDLMHHELAIHAVDLTTLEVYPVEQRTITDRTSPDWVYNGHITIQGDHLMVVRELWQSMCVFVEGLALDGTVVESPQNPLPQPQLAGLSIETIRAMQRGTIDPPAGCLGFDELTDGAMSAMRTEADPRALAAINAELQSAARATMAALAD